ncbi:tautomerase family protein [Luteimonas sp. SX5]|uniref:Tautomerase family protein n=1 Tax=Luteimonas galliterrae TaxID=2940486 RepID=A0ABT0MLR2_9GAMM|nr:tautomerase family protein [Luteimonas galliterrae]MCL1635812.1 tautomerase family protein [Luteimonas galliterrae]
MPLVRIALRAGKPPEHIRAISDGIYAAMRETFAVPEDDRFMLVSQHRDEEFVYDGGYLGIERSDDLVIVQITCNNTRTLEQKKAFYADVARRLAASPGLRPEDVFISLVEVPKENWSFGNGIAQYA